MAQYPSSLKLASGTRHPAHTQGRKKRKRWDMKAVMNHRRRRRRFIRGLELDGQEAVDFVAVGVGGGADFIGRVEVAASEREPHV